MQASGFANGTCPCSEFNTANVTGSSFVLKATFNANYTGAYGDTKYRYDDDGCYFYFRESGDGSASCYSTRYVFVGPAYGDGVTKFDIRLWYDYATDLVKLSFRMFSDPYAVCDEIIYSLPRAQFLCAGGSMTFTYLSGGTNCAVGPPPGYPSTVTVGAFGSAPCCDADGFGDGCGNDCTFCSSQTPSSNYPKNWLMHLSAATLNGNNACNEFTFYPVANAYSNPSMRGSVQLGPLMDQDLSHIGSPIPSIAACAAVVRGGYAAIGTWMYVLYDSTSVDGTWKLWMSASATDGSTAQVLYSIPSANFNCTGDNAFSLVSTTGCTAAPATLTIHPTADTGCWRVPCAPKNARPPDTLHATITDAGGCSCVDPGGGLIVPLTWLPAVVNPSIFAQCTLLWYGEAVVSCPNGQVAVEVGLTCSCRQSDADYGSGFEQWLLFIACYGGSVGYCQLAYTTGRVSRWADAASYSPLQLLFNNVGFGTGGNACCPNGSVNVRVGL